jgi:hypothetical protein
MCVGWWVSEPVVLVGPVEWGLGWLGPATSAHVEGVLLRLEAAAPVWLLEAAAAGGGGAAGGGVWADGSSHCVWLVWACT